MKYIVVDIGCIECGEGSDVLGVFTDRQKAEEVMKKCENYQEKHWYGEHYFEIFEVNKENELSSPYYIEALNKDNK